MPIGVIPIDSIYNSISKVNYQVENTRIGQKNIYDKLTLDVWTDGSIAPQRCCCLAARILTGALNIFVNLTNETHPSGNSWSKRRNSKKKRLLEMTIEELDLSSSFI